MRNSGILMHITSLPSSYGIGSMGKCAYEFVDFLHEAGQTYWQILPLCPTGFGDSPYQSFSTFAGNHYLIDIDMLIEEGLIKKQEVDDICWGTDETRVDYGSMFNNRLGVLRKAYERFEPDDDFARFVSDNTDWIENYAMFMALKEHFGGDDRLKWPLELVNREASAMEHYRRELESDIRFHCFLQYVFFRQWEALRKYTNEKGIRIIGDVPIYVPLDSADVWSEPHLFMLDENRRPKMVAGCPPDSFTADGQLWGNPLYDWEKIKNTGYEWWIRRLKSASKIYDVVRLDHFRGFESYWAVPAGDKTAAGGSWQKGPGTDFTNAVCQAIPDLDFIAEDLGYMTPEVRRLQQDFGYPGMKVMLFAFDSRETSDYLPHTYPVRSVCYSGTHDNMTVAQWIDEAPSEDVTFAKSYLGLNEEEGMVKGLIRGCMGSVSELCIVQMQDYLELGAEGRMNSPGTLSVKNWTWRAKPGYITEELTKRILETSRRYGRV